MQSLPEKFVITVGRQMGSGGRRLGRLIADRLAIAYYDKELLLQAAREAGLSPQFFEQNDERRPNLMSSMLSFAPDLKPLTYFDGIATSAGEMLYRVQCDYIRHVADNGPCVIVGRTADYVLRDHDNVVNIFVHADEESCINRIISRKAGTTPKQARDIMTKTNKSRAAFYNFFTDKHWGEAAGYDLTLNSSRMPLEDLADIVIDFVKRYFAAK